MRAIKGTLQLLLALVCLFAALVYCVILGGGALVRWLWELGDEFFRAALNTELIEFFKAKRP